MKVFKSSYTSLPLLLLVLFITSCKGTEKNVEGLPVGSPCKSSSDCADKLVCIYTSNKDENVVNLFPGGYCSRYCLNDKDCVEGSKCIGNVCIADCKNCELRKDEGYTCLNGKYCIPDLEVGKACSSDSECPTKHCLVYNDKFKNGYCSMRCEEGSDCPLSSGGLCVNFEGKDDGKSSCAKHCLSDSECRTSEKYACRLVLANSAEAGEVYTTVCSGVDNLGATCQRDEDCSKGLRCIGKSEIVKNRAIKGGDFAESICSKECTTDKDCPHIFDCKADDQNCLKTARCIDGYCFRGCENDNHCAKTKYACRGYEYTEGNQNKVKYFCNSVSNIGAACTKNEDCTDGLKCVSDNTEFVGGFCTKDCSKDEDCPLEVGIERACINGKCQRTCKTDSDCGRKEYLCFENEITKKGICKYTKNIGAACKTDDDCSEGLSCYTGYAFPDGYCTKRASVVSECGNNSVLGNIDLCMRACDSDKDCKREGYICFNNGSEKYCSTGFNVGYPCSDHEDKNVIDCGEGLKCVKDKEFEFGYCTMDCQEVNEPCPPDSKCIPSKKMCMRLCSQDNHCLISDYTCRKEDNEYVCVGGKNIGAECSSDSDCSSDTICDTKQTNGYCTVSCKDGNCPDGSVCVGEWCKRICKLDRDCGRRFYFCLSSKGYYYCSSGLNIGAECTSDDDCVSPLKCYKPYPDKIGMCSNDHNQPCSGDAQCGASYAVCNKDGDKHCYRKCTTSADCGREDMKCSNSMCIYK
ncbi:MAG: hypothetical protein N2746_00880 [Deltaproteobacteria bacterium]|nr:hypothetical protein [Deltaproteobacteria bacterium]